MRTIGLLGGMSWVSTGHYYELINRDAAERLGGDHCAPLVIWQGDFAAITVHQRAGEWDRAGEILAEGARALVRAGAEVVGIGANTMHLVADQVEAALDGVPLVHVVDVVGARCAELGVQRLGLLGTAYTMESDALYPARLALAGIEVVVPDAADRAEVQRITFEELIRGVVAEPSVDAFGRIAGSLIARGCDAIALACTEHGLLLGDGDLEVPVLDSTELHARALVDAASA